MKAPALGSVGSMAWRDVVAAILTLGKEATTEAIVNVSGRPRGSVARALRRLCAAGELRRDRHGHYVLVMPADKQKAIIEHRENRLMSQRMLASEREERRLLADRPTRADIGLSTRPPRSALGLALVCPHCGHTIEAQLSATLVGE